MKILVADDSPIVGKKVAQLLREYGDCEITENGLKAFSLFCASVKEGAPYDLICFDLQIPGMNGYQAIRKIREIERSLSLPEDKIAKVIVISAYEKDTTIDKAVAAGCDGFVYKSLLDEELASEVERLFMVKTEE